jgi:hypothetical protein
VSIVADWNRIGSPATVHGGLWTQRTLRGILRSPRIAGLSEHKGKVVGWFAGGTLNVAANCLDRHLAERGDRVAVFWRGEPGDRRAP